jgi:UDP-N-acetylmuramate: L-alanyl-gamma-D-glutamyl-meso-diaminopimelate ligase
MTAEYFNIETLANCRTLERGSKISVLGICGSAMGQLAMLLQQEGYQVSGYDREFYDPMLGLLTKSNIECKYYHEVDDIPDDTKIVVIGNSVRKDNPLLIKIKEREIPYTILPTSIGEYLVKDKKPIVVTGTHGKSTTSSLLASTLRKMKVDAGYFIGAKMREFPVSFQNGNSIISILEGDEYDSAFFAKLPKFHFYNPYFLIITSLEFDHADIYTNQSEIEDEFTKLVAKRPEGSFIIVCIDTYNLKSLVELWKKIAKATIITYSKNSSNADYDTENYTVKSLKWESGLQHVYLQNNKNLEINYQIPLPGLHNALNSAAAYIALKCAGFAESAIIENFAAFGGVVLRLDILVDQSNITIIRDFAHHPTAIKVTIESIRQMRPDTHLCVLFEPRSYTSRHKHFQNDFAEALNLADSIGIQPALPRNLEKPEDLIDVVEVTNIINSYNKLTKVFTDSTEAIQMVTGLRSQLNASTHLTVVLMSNGDFGGLPEKLSNVLRGRSIS